MVLTRRGLNDGNNIANIYCVITLCFMQSSSHNAHRTPRQSCHCDKCKWHNHILPREAQTRQDSNIRINLGLSLWVHMSFVLSFYLVTMIQVAGQDFFSSALRIQGSETHPPWIPLEQRTNGKERSQGLLSSCSLLLHRSTVLIGSSDPRWDVTLKVRLLKKLWWGQAFPSCPVARSSCHDQV